jgi:hypothetical protein
MSNGFRPDLELALVPGRDPAGRGESHNLTAGLSLSPQRETLILKCFYTLILVHVSVRTGVARAPGRHERKSCEQAQHERKGNPTALPGTSRVRLPRRHLEALIFQFLIDPFLKAPSRTKRPWRRRFPRRRSMPSRSVTSSRGSSERGLFPGLPGAPQPRHCGLPLCSVLQVPASLFVIGFAFPCARDG